MTYHWRFVVFVAEYSRRNIESAGNTLWWHPKARWLLRLIGPWIKMLIGTTVGTDVSTSIAHQLHLLHTFQLTFIPNDQCNIYAGQILDGPKSGSHQILDGPESGPHQILTACSIRWHLGGAARFWARFHLLRIITLHHSRCLLQKQTALCRRRCSISCSNRIRRRWTINWYHRPRRFR